MQACPQFYVLERSRKAGDRLAEPVPYLAKYSACKCSRSTSAAGSPNLINLAGATRLDEAIALIARADAVVANDSGLLHIASALNRPVVALYGPTDPDHAPPFSDIAASLSLRLDCSPCRQRECPLGHHNCMQQMKAEMVWGALRPMI